MGAGRGAGPPHPGGGMPVLGPGGPRSGWEGGSEQRPPGAGPSPLMAPSLAGAHLGHLAGLWRLGVLEGGHLLAGELQVPLARGLQPAVAHAAVVKAPALPVLPLQLPVSTDPEPLGRAPAGADRAQGACHHGGGSKTGHVCGELTGCVCVQWEGTGHVWVQWGVGGRLTPRLSVQGLDGQRQGNQVQGLRAEPGAGGREGDPPLQCRVHPQLLDPLQPPCRVYLPGTEPPGPQFPQPGTWAACPRFPERGWGTQKGAWGPGVSESVGWGRGVCCVGEHVGRGGTCAHLRMLWDSEAWRRKPGRFSGLPSCHRPRGSWRLTLFRRAGFLGLCPPDSWRWERETGCDSVEL